MIIVNADAVEATATTLSAAEALEVLAPAANSLTGAEAAALRAMCAAVGCASTNDMPIMSVRAALLALCAPFLCIVQIPCGPR